MIKKKRITFFLLMQHPFSVENMNEKKCINNEESMYKITQENIHSFDIRAPMLPIPIPCPLLLFKVK